MLYFPLFLTFCGIHYPETAPLPTTDLGLYACLLLFYSILFQFVHRCGAVGSMRACHAAGPGSNPGRDKFPGEVFPEFFLICKTNIIWSS